MRSSLAREDRLVEYLLGQMPEKERLELQQRLFRDDELDEELLVTTDDLVCAYLAGELPDEDRSRFEMHFLASPQNREHLGLMKDFLTAVDRVSEKGVPAVQGRPAAAVQRSRRWVLAAAASIAVALAVGMVSRRQGQGDERVTATRLPTAPAMASAPTRPEPPMPRVPPPSAVQVVRLAGKPGTPVNVRLSSSTRAVRAELRVDEDSLSFDAAVLSRRGKAVWRAEGLAPTAPGQPLVLEIPAEVFASDQYTLRVESESLRAAAAPTLEYRLRVVRER
jgi:hypothetical protein